MDTDFIGTLSIIEFSEAWFWAGIPTVLFWAKLFLEQWLEGWAWPTVGSCWHPSPAMSLAQSRIPSGSSVAQLCPAAPGWGVTESGLPWWCCHLLKNLEPAWRAHSSWACEISHQTPPRNSPLVILMASENWDLLQSTASCRKAVKYVPCCWYTSLFLPGAWKEQATVQGCAGLPRSLMVSRAGPHGWDLGLDFKERANIYGSTTY